MECMPEQTFNRIIERHAGNAEARNFGCANETGKSINICPCA